MARRYRGTMRDLFDGETYDPDRDEDRLFRQLREIRAEMADGLWHTLPELSKATGHPETSVSARIRDLRKKRWGAHEVIREFVHRGLHRYRLVLPGRELGGR
jgi:hypothetical protein